MAKKKNTTKTTSSKSNSKTGKAGAKKMNKPVTKKPEIKAKKSAPAKVTDVGRKKNDSKDAVKKIENIKSVVSVKENEKNNAKSQSITQPIKAAELSAKAKKIESKASAKTKSKSKKADKKEDDFSDDLLDDSFGDSEIAEYEEDLKAVEDSDEEETDLEIDETETDEKDVEVYLTDSEGRRLCRVRDCDQISIVEGYCRYHYLFLWKKIQIRKSILQDGKLEKYVIDLTARYPDKFLEVIRKDLKTEKDFLSIISEMEIDESAISEMEGDDDAQSFADEIRGIGEAPAMDDDGDY